MSKGECKKESVPPRFFFLIKDISGVAREEKKNHRINNDKHKNHVGYF